MPENERGVNPDDPQNQNADGTGGQDAAGQHGGEQTVPLTALQKERQARQAEQQRREETERRLQAVEQQSSGGQQQSDDPLEGIEDDEPLTAAQVRKMREQDQARTNAVLAEVELRSKVPDYDDVIKNYLPQKIQENPNLQNAFDPNDPRDMVKAYELGKEVKQRQGGQSGNGADQEGDSQQSELEATLEQNQNKPGSASQAASSTQAPPSGQERISEKARKSPKELDDEIRKAKRGEI